MEISRYNRAECLRLLDDESFWAANVLPTSRLRMLSYVNNPRVRDDDVLLYAAHKDGQLVSYIALLPDFIRASKDAELTPFGWPSSWWAAPDSSLGPAASILLFKTLADWQGEIALSGFSEAAKVVIDASRRFKDLQIFDFCAYAIVLPSEFKGRRIPGAPVNALLGLKNRFYASRADRSPAQWSVIDSVDEATDRFICEQTQLDLFPRDGAFFDWLIKFPWDRKATKEDSEAGSEMKRYVFAGFSSSFSQLPIKIENDGKLIGFLFFTLRNDFLTLKYAIFPAAETVRIKECVQAIALHYGLAYLWCADDRLNRALQADRAFFLACKHVPVPFYVGKRVEYDTQARLHYGLGDRVMT